MTHEPPLDLSLRTLQEWFQAVITEPESAVAGVRGLSAVVPEDDLPRVVRPGATETALERLHIYHHSYFARLVECLADDYPALAHALGEAPFERLCHEYITRYPSREPNLNGFGGRMPRFLQEERADLGQFAAELAQLEWALVEVIHAEAAAPLDAEALRALAPDELLEARFVVSPAVRLLSFEYAVDDYFQAFMDDARPSTCAAGPSSVLVVRSGFKIWRLSLEPAAFTLLRRLVDGQPLGRALEGVSVDPAQITSWFQDWTSRAVFQGVVAGPR